eukprot:4289562-Amphidinium_carterae.1
MATSVGPLQRPHQQGHQSSDQRDLPTSVHGFRSGNSTGYAQPLDVAVRRPFKSRMKHHATETLMDAMGDESDLVALWKRANMDSWVAASVADLIDMSNLVKKAWKHLDKVAGDEAVAEHRFKARTFFS